MNGADLLCETLLVNGIDTCFANPGTSEMHFVAALDRQPRIRCILGLFEGVVTGAADGYARMADRPAATLLHTGPGLTNGLANLHNARRAYTPMVNVVGDHATHHLIHDAPLTSDIESLARPMSQWVGRVESAETLGRQTEAAIRAATAGRGGVATLILPADAAWNPTNAPPPVSLAAPTPAPVDMDRIRAAAEALRNGRPTTILVSGRALRQAQLANLQRIADRTGARLLAQQSNGRIERGAGRVAIERVPYPIDMALATFAATEQLILIEAKAPVGFFAYPGKPGSMLPETCRVLDAHDPQADVAQTIAALADAVGAAATMPLRLNALAPSELAADGPLTPVAIEAAVAHLMPEHSIICDEAVTSMRAFFANTHTARPHDFLQLTGGAIGIGLPMATGAAVACPDRKVIALQADGSGMYTLQALWTQARERLDVVTVIFANRRYNILHGELQNVGAGVPGENARRMLDLVDPVLDWVQMARGMGVEGARAETVAQFNDLLATACRGRGPFLIEAVI